VKVADRRRTADARLADHRAALGAREARERAVPAPHAQLQAFLAEDAVERFLDDARFLQQQRLPERRLQPVLHDL
jgi:hypothetical protein